MSYMTIPKSYFLPLIAKLLMPCVAVCSCPAADAESSALALPARVERVEIQRLLDLNEVTWNTIAKSQIHLNRTPPLYEGDPGDNGDRPGASVQLIQTTNQDLVVRIHWTDFTTNVTAKGVRYPDNGNVHTYKLHTEASDQFADACCIMVPVKRGVSYSFPPLMMGGTNDAVELYYWRAGKAPELLKGHGRGTTASTSISVPGNGVRDGDGWTVTMVVPGVTRGTPVSFAIWDGGRLHRDGLKFYSLWYEIK